MELNNLINLQGESLKLYHSHRNGLIELSERIRPILERAQTIQNRAAAYETPAEALKKDAYTLVLIGAFQSGKSTLFNYLCDGRELSPIGPGGGGVRTSGCMVTAHPIAEGAQERASVTWRKPEQLLAALGTPLLKYFEEPTSTQAITPNDIDLYNPADRDKLAGFAIEELQNGNTKDEELLRFTLVACRFFDRFASRCEADFTECSPEEAVKLTSYPQDWLPRWEQIENNGWNLDAFTEEEVNFAFCGGVELYLDSAFLRSMGCSVIDCPGLFISKWDSEIATDCIRKANAILYMFGGRQAMTQEDIRALESCVQLGGRHKIIFGANLHVGRTEWNRILTNGVLPTLRKHGFENPLVHNFHSALALRSRELLLSNYGLLSDASRNAIGISMASHEFTDSADEYLKYLLNTYISNLTSFKQNLGNYMPDYAALEDLSGVPGFVQAANAHVVGTRATSMLIHEGVHKMTDSLREAESELMQQRDLLNMEVDKAQEECDKQRKRLADFRESRRVHEDAISAGLDTAVGDIYSLYWEKLNKVFQNRENELVDATEKHMPGLLDMAFRDKNSLILQYTEALGEVLSSILKQVSDDIRDNFKTIHPVSTLKHVFEGNRKELMKKLAGFNGIGSISDMEVYFPDDFADSVSGMALPAAGDIFDRKMGEENNLWNWIWAILCCGINRLFINDRARAQYIINDYKPKLIELTFSRLKECMEQQAPDGPITCLQKTVQHFKDCFLHSEKQIADAISAAEEVLATRRGDASIVGAIEDLLGQIRQQKDECHVREQRIRADFPSLN